MDGQPLEIIVIRWIYKMYLTPAKRKKKTLTYQAAREKVKRDTEKELLKKMTAAKRKKYLKDKKNGFPVKYMTKGSEKIYR